MGIRLANPSVTVNNDIVMIVPNSLVFDEGLGEQNVSAVSGGGGNIEQIYSENVETNFAMVKFDIPPTISNIEKARSWKKARNQNLVQITGRTADGETLTRTFSQASLPSNYEVPLGSDTNITLEFKSNPAV